MSTIETKLVRVETRKRIKLTGEDLRHFAETAIENYLPANVDIFVEVPGGGDWSNQLLEITKENPVIITWVETVESHD